MSSRRWARTSARAPFATADWMIAREDDGLAAAGRDDEQHRFAPPRISWRALSIASSW
jgi:hypothetical protein